MTNRNEASYTNFGDNKTNKRIVQAPGGSTSLSLGWDDNTQEKQKGYDRPSYQQAQQSYGGNNKYGQQGYDDVQLYGKGQNGKKDNNVTGKVGGEHGYNSYNPVSQQGGGNIPKGYQQPYTQSPMQSDYSSQQQRYEQPDPQSYYQPSTTSSNKKVQNQLDYALQQQKHKIESSRGNRSSQSNSSYQQQQQQQDTRPCVKIHQQKNNHIFGDQYDYWKQDNHTTNTTQQSNHVKEQQFLYEKQSSQQQQQQQQQYAKKGGDMYGGSNNTNNQKTSVKVHNPPGGRSNFTFG